MHKVMAADIFVYLDTVQYSKNGLQNRNQIKSAQGPLWLTVPVKQHLGLEIRKLEIADPKATGKHFKTLQANYARSEGFRNWSGELETMLTSQHTLMSELAIASTEWMLDKLNVKTKRVKASELVGVEGQSSDRVASICQVLDADVYLTGRGALSYLELSDFEANNCNVMVQEWKPFEYQQCFPETGFVPDLSTIDLILNCPDEAAQLIDTAGSWSNL
jgi:hypothetical protein